MIESAESSQPSRTLIISTDTFVSDFLTLLENYLFHLKVKHFFNYLKIKLKEEADSNFVKKN